MTSSTPSSTSSRESIARRTSCLTSRCVANAPRRRASARAAADANLAADVDAIPSPEHPSLVATQGWLQAILPKIPEDEQDAFKKRVTPGVKRLAGMAKELQVFTGPSMDPDATMVFAYYKEGADAPTFVYFKDALKAVKC